MLVRLLFEAKCQPKLGHGPLLPEEATEKGMPQLSTCRVVLKIEALLKISDLFDAHHSPHPGSLNKIGRIWRPISPFSEPPVLGMVLSVSPGRQLG